MKNWKRLQTFPDDYKILGNRAIASKQIGNSVPPQFARMLGLVFSISFSILSYHLSLTT
ncbi:MAG: DNA cytosine methyltransferase [Chitinophagaceae bacterium]|nr:DNA cytosine methyltransferase [Chitinophagaceae bacterium]